MSMFHTALRVIALLAVVSSIAWGQQPGGTTPADSAAAVQPGTPAATPPAATPPPATTQTAAATAKPAWRERIYYGGTVTLSFGNATRIGIAPMLAYKLTPKLSAGVEVGYEYVNYDDFDQSSHNYGGSVFGRYRLIPQLYAHAEYQLVNYDIPTGIDTSERETVPFLLVGGGFCKRVAPNAWAYLEVLVDVLQDDKSPYEDWDPVVSIGVGVGF
jgi:hypothetical protein